MSDIIHNVITDPHMINSADMSANQTSTIEQIDGMTCYAAQYKWTTFVGAATIFTEGSNVGGIDPNDWTAVDTFLPTTGTTSNRMLNVEKAGYRFVRVRYVVNSASSGTLTVTFNGKGI